MERLGKILPLALANRFLTGGINLLIIEENFSKASSLQIAINLIITL
jgi:hypothetical protein